MSQDLADRVREGNLPAVVTNSTFRLAPWADVLYAADSDWWRSNPDAREFRGVKVCLQDDLLWPEVFSLKVTGKDGYDQDPRCIRHGGNSGYQALHVAVQAGACRVLLCGFDMQGGHWHAGPSPAAALFATWIARLERLAPILKERGVEVFNCSRESALACFPFFDIETDFV